MSTGELSILLLGVSLAYFNGANDVSKGIATLVGSGLATYRIAMIWGTLWTVAGSLCAMVFSMEMVRTFSTGVTGEVHDPAYFATVIVGAIGWIGFATVRGLPVSTTHAITGALVGGGIAVAGLDGVFWAVLSSKILLPLLLSPVVAYVLTVVLLPPVCRVLMWVDHYCLCIGVERAEIVTDAGTALAFRNTPDIGAEGRDLSRCDSQSPAWARVFAGKSLHFLSAGMASFARGLNDAPKIAALAIGGQLAGGLDAGVRFVAVACAIGVGSYVQGRKVTRTLSSEITPMTHAEGFAANAVTAVLVALGARFGLPLSTTHVSTSAIVAIGTQQRQGAVSWKRVGDIGFAWLVTLPVSAAITYVGLQLLKSTAVLS
jgi:inorganic phosphate transporter, PiT family